MKLERSDRAPLWAFMTPALVLMLVFFVIPVIYVIVVSFLKWNGINTPAFVNFKNFMLLFRDRAFKRSVINNVIWALVAGFIQVLRWRPCGVPSTARIRVFSMRFSIPSVSGISPRTGLEP